jgi:hypothetical protein
MNRTWHNCALDDHGPLGQGNGLRRLSTKWYANADEQRAHPERLIALLERHAHFLLTTVSLDVLSRMIY